jgi:hypothetical protein
MLADMLCNADHARVDDDDDDDGIVDCMKAIQDLYFSSVKKP